MVSQRRRVVAMATVQEDVHLARVAVVVAVQFGGFTQIDLHVLHEALGVEYCGVQMGARVLPHPVQVPP